MPPSHVATTERLLVRWLDAGDAPFVVELLNEPSWIRFIGDRNVRTPDDALRYIAEGPARMYDQFGFGLNAVQSKETGEPMGICGLIKRDSLDDVDLGFAFLPRFWGRGYALEAASAVLAHGRSAKGLARVVAILSADNHRSRKLLETLGFGFERKVRIRADDDELDLYAAAL